MSALVTNMISACLAHIAASLADVPGGLDVLYEIARERHPNEILPYKEFFLNADPAGFGPKLRQAITPIITEELIPEYVGRNRKALHELAAPKKQTTQPGGPRDTLDGLVALYERAGHDDYGWRIFVDTRRSEWWYHSFDPIPAEQVPFDQLVWRYRDVTLPDGMENWRAPGFDPAAAGWKRGHAPFAQYDGELPVGPVSKCSAHCTGPNHCYGASENHTLWEKEVLLLRKTIEVPPFKDGHRYRLRVNHRDPRRQRRRLRHLGQREIDGRKNRGHRLRRRRKALRGLHHRRVAR